MRLIQSWHNCLTWSPCAQTQTSSLFHDYSIGSSTTFCWKPAHMFINLCMVANLPCLVLACGSLFPASLPQCGNQSDQVGWLATCRKQWIQKSHTEAAPMFDMHNEPVHHPAERYKLHWQCFRWLSVTPSSAVCLDSRHHQFLYQVSKNHQCAIKIRDRHRHHHRVAEHRACAQALPLTSCFLAVTEEYIE